MTVRPESTSLQELVFNKGLHGESDAAAIPAGYCLDAINCDFTAGGVVRKRSGYSIYGGLPPIRLYHISEQVGESRIVSLDRQVLFTVSTYTCYPFGTMTNPNFVNSLLPYYSTVKQQFNNVFLLQVDEEDITSLGDRANSMYLQYRSNDIPILYKLTETLFVISKKYSTLLSGYPSDLIPEIGVEVSGSVLEYTIGPTLLSPDLSSVTNIVRINENTLEIHFGETGFDLQVGDKVKFETSVVTDVGGVSLDCTVTETTNNIVTLTTTGTDIIILEDLDLADGTPCLNFMRISVLRGNKVAILFSSQQDPVSCFVDYIEGPASFAIPDSSPVPEGYGLFWGYGISLTTLPPVCNIYTYPSPGTDEICILSQNWLLKLDHSFTACDGVGYATVTTASDSLIPLINGEYAIPVDYSLNFFKEGDTAHWTEFANSQEGGRHYEYKVSRVSSGIIYLSGTSRNLFVRAGTKIYFKRTSNQVPLFSSDPYLVYGASFKFEDAIVHCSGYTYGTIPYVTLSREVTFDSYDKVYLQKPFTPIPIAGDSYFQYQGLNPASLPWDVVRYQGTVYGSRLYIACEEGGIWRYNGDNLSSMKLGAPPLPLVRSVPGSTGSLDKKRDSEGTYADTQRISVTYYWEDADGRGYESTYVSSDDLRVRPKANDGDAEQLELCIPTIPEGLGIPANEVKIRVYHISEEAESAIMTLGAEVDNIPTQATVTVVIGDKYTKFFGTESKDQAFIDVARDSPAPAPLAKFVSVSNGRLVAAGGTSYPVFEFIIDNLFKDGDFSAYTRLTFTDILGNHKKFITVPVTSTDIGTTIEKFPAGDPLGSEGFKAQCIAVSPVPAESYVVSYIQYQDTSSVVTFQPYTNQTWVFYDTWLSGKRHALLTVVGTTLNWSLDYSGTIFVTPEVTTHLASTVYNIYASERQKESISLAEAVGNTPYAEVFYENFYSNGQPFLNEFAIFILNGAIYLGGSASLASQISHIDSNTTFLRFWFWNEDDATLGNITNEEGRVLSWHRDLVFFYEPTTDFIEYAGIGVSLLRLIPVDTQSYSTTGYFKRLNTDSWTMVDVSHRPNGNSHGSFSIFYHAGATWLRGQQLLPYPAATEPAHSYVPSFSLPDRPYGVSKIIRAFIDFSGAGIPIHPGDVLNFKFYEDAGHTNPISFDQKNYPGFPDLRQPMKVVYVAHWSAIFKGEIFLEVVRPPEEVYDVKNSASSTLSQPITRARISSSDEFHKAYGNFYLPTNYATIGDIPNLPDAGQWVFINLAGVAVDEVYQEYSGWFQYAETQILFGKVCMGFVKADTGDKGTRGYNSLKYGFMLWGLTPDIIPIPVPFKEDIVSARKDVAYALFSRTEDEGNGPYNCFLNRYALAINTVLKNSMVARLGTSPSGDFASDIYPANGIQITSNSLVNKYFTITKIKSLADTDYSVAPYTRTILPITPERASLPEYIITVQSLSGFARVFGSLETKNWRSGTFEFPGTEMCTFTDFKLGSQYWWGSKFTSDRNEVRLPVFTFLETDDLQSYDKEDITGVEPWQDALIMTKPEGVWKVVVGDEAESRRVQSVVGCKYPGSLVATEIGVFFLSDSGVFYTDGNGSYSVDRVERYFDKYSSKSKGSFPFAVSFNNTLTKELYIGAPYSEDAVSIPNARYKMAYSADAWSVDTNIYASGYALINGVEFYSSWNGYCLKERTESGPSKWDDEYSPIHFYLRTAYQDVSDPSIKFYRQFIAYLGQDSGYTLDVRHSCDFQIGDGGIYTTLPVKPALFGSGAFGITSFGGSAYVAPYRVSLAPKRVAHVSLSFENNSSGSPVELFSVWLEAQKLNRRPVKEPYHYGK